MDEAKAGLGKARRLNAAITVKWMKEQTLRIQAVFGTSVGMIGIKARLQIDARKWVAAKLLPKKYGDRARGLPRWCCRRG